jgi:hypothetical protein
MIYYDLEYYISFLKHSTKLLEAEGIGRENHLPLKKHSSRAALAWGSGRLTRG